MYRWNLELNSTQRESEIWSLTPSLTSKWHRTVKNHTSIDWSHILNAGHVGNVVAVAVAVAAGDGLAAAGDGRPTHMQNSWESYTRFSRGNKAAEMIEWLLMLPYQLLRDIMKAVLIDAAPIIGRFCHRWVHTSWLDPSTDLAANIAFLFGLNLWPGRT